MLCLFSTGAAKRHILPFHPSFSHFKHRKRPGSYRNCTSSSWKEYRKVHFAIAPLGGYRPLIFYIIPLETLWYHIIPTELSTPKMQVWLLELLNVELRVETFLLLFFFYPHLSLSHCASSSGTAFPTLPTCLLFCCSFFSFLHLPRGRWLPTLSLTLLEVYFIKQFFCIHCVLLVRLG